MQPPEEDKSWRLLKVILIGGSDPKLHDALGSKALSFGT
jgi:hypothetical protein